MTSAALVLLMTPGVAFFYGGAVNHKNVISTMYQSFVAIGVITILWVIIGNQLYFTISVRLIDLLKLTFRIFTSIR
jgi:Amt family ammonium transporter